MANADLSSSIAQPHSDPTALTTEQLLRTAQAERDYVDGRIDVLIERLAGMDRATELLSATVNKVPTETQREVNHLAGVMTEKFQSVDQRFNERDTRSERESRDNRVAVDAAFAAQKEAAAEQNKANTKAIDKSEEATVEAISKLGILLNTRTDALADKIDDLKQRVQAIESAKQQVSESITGNYQTREPATAARMLYVAMGAAAFSLIAVAVAIAVALTA